MTKHVAQTVEMYFVLPATGGDYFTLGDPVKGKLGDTTYLLAGTTAVDVTEFVASMSFFRGRNRELDELNPGQLWMTLHNYDGRFTPDALLTGTPTMPYGAGNIKPGKRVTVRTEQQVVFDGIVQSWQYVYDRDGRATVSVYADDALGQLGRRRFNSWTATSGQTAGQRIGDILDRAEVNWGPNRALDTGISTLQGDSVTYGSNVLNYAQLAARSDLGRFFADRRGTLTFRDRHNLVNQTPAATFTDDAGTVPGITIREIRPATTDELLYTDVSVDREGGTAQTVSSSDARDEYGIRRLDINGLLLDSDSQSASMAAYLHSIYSKPQPRIEQIDIRLDGLSDVDKATTAAIDLADLVRVYWPPKGLTGYPMDALFVVEGVTHRSDALGTYDVQLRLSPVYQSQVFVLGNESLGRLGSGVLAF